MEELILYVVIFVLVYLFYIIFVLHRKNVFKNFIDSKEIKYLKIKYGIKVNDSNLKKIANKIFLANSFILATTVTILSLFESLLLQILVGIITLVVLILFTYHLIGIYYKKKQGGKKHV